MDEKTAVQLHALVRDLITDIDASNLLFRRQNYFEGLQKVKGILNNFQEAVALLCEHAGWFNQDVVLFEPEAVVSEITMLLAAQQEEDYILLADLYELNFLPFLFSIQSYLIKQFTFLCDDGRFMRTNKLLMERSALVIQRDVFEIFENGFAIEHSADGAFALSREKDGKKHYLNSRSRVFLEARHLAEGWHETDTNEYVVYGLGLGYHIKALLEISAYADIRVYESNMDVVLAAAAFGVLEELLLDERVSFFYDSDFKGLNSYLVELSENSRFFVHGPSLWMIDDTQQRESLEGYFIQYSSYKSQKKYLDANFFRNIAHYDAPVDELKSEFIGKDIYLIAGGPSLDKNMEELKSLDSLKGKSVIIAVGTVYAKLLRAGIRPDYVVATDAKPNTYAQLHGLLEEEIPLIGLSTLYYGFFKNYSGKKYMICQKDYDKSEAFAAEHSWMLFETGGSVVTAALDVSLKFLPARVIFVGLDLAYTGGMRHASGTVGSQSADETNVLYTEDVSGALVATGKNLNLYRRWIESRLARERNVQIIDATEGGALIKGTRRMMLREAILLQ